MKTTYNIVVRSNNDSPISERVYYDGLTKEDAEEIEIMTNHKLDDDYPFYFQAMPSTYQLQTIN